MADQAKQKSIKRLNIDKANSTVVAISAGAAFIVVFCLFATRTLLSQMNYQNRVLGAKHTAVTQLKNDLSSINQLKTSYQAFVNQPQNMMGGNPNGTGAQDGNNAQIVLDALPGQYDFPGLVSSLQKLLSGQGYTVTSISGTDQSSTLKTAQGTGKPSPQQIPFQVSATGSYSSIQTMVNTMQLSIRPIVIQSIDLSGQDSKISASITAYTYYQPQMNFTIGSETVK